MRMMKMGNEREGKRENDSEYYLKTDNEGANPFIYVLI